MQPLKLQRSLPARDQRSSVHRIHQTTCRLVDADGNIDLKVEAPCESVRALLQELQNLRAAQLGAEWRLDRLGRVLLIGGNRVKLTRTQLSIVEVMVRANGDFVCVYDLLMGVWGFAQPIGGGELVRTHIRAIRRRLRECQISDDFINGSRGRGYRINPKFLRPAAATSPRATLVSGSPEQIRGPSPLRARRA